MTNNNLVTQFLSQINTAIDYKLNSLSQIKSAVVHSVNQDGTVNIYIPPSQTIYHNIQNQSIYRNLKSGDNIKVIVENGSLSNMWIIGGFQLQVESNISSQVNVDIVYPIGSIYISVNNSNPQFLFGGKWEQIQDCFLLASGAKYKAGDVGGESEHILTISEMPSHNHNIKLNKGTDDSIFSSASAEFQGGDTNAPEFNTTYIYSTGGNQPHNNMPPYLTVYMWKRIG